MLRANREAFGHRMLMDFIVPGGVACDLTSGPAAALLEQCTRLEREVRTLHAIYDDHAGPAGSPFAHAGACRRSLPPSLA